MDTMRVTMRAVLLNSGTVLEVRVVLELLRLLEVLFLVVVEEMLVAVVVVVVVVLVVELEAGASGRLLRSWAMMSAFGTGVATVVPSE